MSEAKPNQPTLDDLHNIRKCLREYLLPAEKPVGLDYAIDRNLHHLDKYLKSKDEMLSIINKKYYFKDAADEPLNYAFYADPSDPLYTQLKTDENGNYIIIEKEEKEKGKIATCNRIDLNNPKYIAEVEEWKKDIEFKFYKFKTETVKQNFADGNFKGIDISPLFGWIIDEFEE